MLLKFDYKSPLNLLSISVFILPFQTFIGIIILLFIVYNSWRNNYHKIITNKFTHYLIILTGLMVISCLFAQRKDEAFLGLIHFIPFFFLFLGSKYIITKYEHLYYLILPIIFNSIIISIMGIGEVKLGWQTPNFIYKTLGWRLIAYGTPEGRMSSVFPHANPLSLYLFTALFFTLAILIERWKKFYFDKINITLIGIISVQIISLILTSSRNGWLISFLSFIVFSIYLNWTVILSLFIFGGFLISWASFGNLPAQNWGRKIVPSFFWSRLSDQMYPDRPLPTLRTSQWEFCLDLIKDRPFFGWGLRNFSILYEAKTATYLGHPHNLFLMISAEMGLINLMVMIGIIAKILWEAIKVIRQLNKQKKDTLILFSYIVIFCGYTMYNFVDVSIFDLRLNILAWLILGSILGVSENYNSDIIPSLKTPIA